MQRMVKKHAIIKKLPAVETLGSATVICSDKTGTLTQNKMTVLKFLINGQVHDVEEGERFKLSNELDKLINVCVLCNDTKIAEDDSLQGDPTETALTALAMKLGYSIEEISKNERVGEFPFDSERKLMTTIHKVGDKYYAYTKGGIDELLDRCSSYVENGEIKYDIKEYKLLVDELNDQLAQDALRVLAMAYKELDHMPSKEEIQNIEHDLTFIGMVGMIDPPRIEVKAAVDKCKTAGIKTVMITGDHKTTAVAIAKNLGILENEEEAVLGADVDKMTQEELENNVRHISVYARVSPENKVRIVRAWQKQGEISAMTGDGVNDAPALKQADIGCAMGITGTDVSKEAADVILTDDNFATIVSAVEEGRRIYDNILKAIQFLLSSNVGEVILLFIATVLAGVFSKNFGIDLGLIEVLTPVHLLWVNLVTDSLPALALAFEPPDDDIMKRKPLKHKGIFTKGMTWRIIYQGTVIGLLALVAFIIGISTSDYDASRVAEISNWRGTGESYVVNVPDETAVGTILPLVEKTIYSEYVMEDNGKTASLQQIKVMIGQAMAFIVLAFSELVHIFNIRNHKESVLKTGILGNKLLLLAIFIDASLMFVVLLVPALRNVFGIPVLLQSHIWECLALSFAPLLVVEVMKLFKLNGDV
jgi:Ca2+-transporting ATPase